MIHLGIFFYQRFISPYKGFRCGYAAINATCSCSNFAKRAVAKHGSYAGLKLAKDRMRRCGEAVAGTKGRQRQRQNYGRFGMLAHLLLQPVRMYQKRFEKKHIHLKNSKRKARGKNEDYCDLPCYVCDCAGMIPGFFQGGESGTASSSSCDFDWGPCDAAGPEIGCDIGGCSP